MKSVLVINPTVSPDIRRRLADKLGRGYAVSYVEDLLDAEEGEKLVKVAIAESEFLVFVVIPGVEMEPLAWVVEEAKRMGKRIVVVFLENEDVPVPGFVDGFADAMVGIGSPSFMKAMAGEDVFETPDYQARPSRTLPRGEC